MTEAQKRRQEKIENIRKMYLSGNSRKEIAEAAGYTVRTVNIYLSNMGLLHRHEDKTGEIIRLSDEGKKLSEISREVGLSEGYISSILSKNGRGRRMDRGDKEPDGLIDENTVFADNTPRIYCLRYQGKDWMDITELIARR